MTESAEVEIPDDISFPYCLQTRGISIARSYVRKLRDIFKERLDQAKIPYFYVPGDELAFRVFYQNREGQEHYLLLHIKRQMSLRGFVFKLSSRLVRYENSKVKQSYHKESFKGTIDDYLSEHIEELTGLQIHPPEIDYLGTIIKKTPPMCFYNYFRSQWWIGGLLEGLYYKIEANLN